MKAERELSNTDSYVWSADEGDVVSFDWTGIVSGLSWTDRQKLSVIGGHVGSSSWLNFHQAPEWFTEKSNKFYPRTVILPYICMLSQNCLSSLVRLYLSTGSKSPQTESIWRSTDWKSSKKQEWELCDFLFSINKLAAKTETVLENN